MPGPAAEKGIIDRAFIDGENVAGVDIQAPGDVDLMGFGRSDADEGGHVVIVVQQDMGLDSAFGPSKTRPREHVQAQGYDRGVQGKQLVFKSEFGLPLAELSHGTESFQGFPKHFLVHRRRPMFVGVGQSGFVRSPENT